MNSTKNIHTTEMSELETLRRQVAKLEKRCATLEEQRDEARLAQMRDWGLNVDDSIFGEVAP